MIKLLWSLAIGLAAGIGGMIAGWIAAHCPLLRKTTGWKA